MRFNTVRTRFGRTEYQRQSIVSFAMSWIGFLLILPFAIAFTVFWLAAGAVSSLTQAARRSSDLKSS